MTRRLVLFALLVCAAAVVALVVPLALAARDSAAAQALRAAQSRAQATAELVAGSAAADVPAVLPAAPGGPGALSVVLADGTASGADPGPGTEPVLAAARTGRAVSVEVGSDVVVASPVQGAAGTSVVLVRLAPDDLRARLGRSLAALGGAGLVLLATAGVTAVALARRTAAPIAEVAEVAHRIADGDLSARAPSSGLPEVAAVGQALNRLAGRVQELLDEERRASADLAHRLRTPLTALAVDLDAVDEPAVRDRLRDDLDALQGSVDDIIRTARRPQREGLAARCDAAEVVASRVRFWAVLAEDQQRRLQVTLPGVPVPVRLAREDLEAAIDVALQNAFVHTPEGTALYVEVSPAPSGGGARVVVDDAGPGWGSAPAVAVGSTGVGLEIAARTAEASGGRLVRATAPAGGARLVLELGPPAE